MIQEKLHGEMVNNSENLWIFIRKWQIKSTHFK